MGLLDAFSLAFHGFLVISLFLKEAELCKIGWTHYKGHCYGLFNNEMTWEEAEIDCHKKATHLASIHFMEEMVHVSQYIRRNIRGDDNVWIGMHAPEKDKRWQWTDHTSIRYLPWDDGEPNNFLFNENCVELRWKKDYIRWNDRKCSVRQPYLCKQMAI